MTSSSISRNERTCSFSEFMVLGFGFVFVSRLRNQCASANIKSLSWWYCQDTPTLVVCELLQLLHSCRNVIVSVSKLQADLPQLGGRWDSLRLRRPAADKDAEAQANEEP